MNIVFNAYYTLIVATIVLLLGRFLVQKIKFLKNFNIPEPVAGGILASLITLLLYQIYGLTITIEKDLQNSLMLMFFASIGLSADFRRLRAGGTPLIVFTIIVSVFIIIQNIVGVTMAYLLDLHPLIGLITGSITLTGGHGTAGGWGETLETVYGVHGAVPLGMACATFGLILGGLLGGPVAKKLLKKIHAKEIEDDINENNENEIVFEQPKHTRLITADSAVETLAMFAICLSCSHYISIFVATHFADAPIKIPTFVWALACGVLVRNILSNVFNFNIFDRCIDVFGNVSLSLFLSMALLSLKLWELSDLAFHILIILTVQVIVMILYVYFITFRFMGKDYDAAVLASGHCGFGMGATPTAIANMQAVTSHFGPSHKAFLIVPMVGAFFVDIVNALILSGFVSLPFLQ